MDLTRVLFFFLNRPTKQTKKKPPLGRFSFKILILNAPNPKGGGGGGEAQELSFYLYI